MCQRVRLICIIRGAVRSVKQTVQVQPACKQGAAFGLYHVTQTRVISFINDFTFLVLTHPASKLFPLTKSGVFLLLTSSKLKVRKQLTFRQAYPKAERPPDSAALSWTCLWLNTQGNASVCLCVTV